MLPHARQHLGLGADHWPLLDVDDALYRAVEAATEYFLLPTLVGEEWCALMPDRGVARRFFEAAQKLDETVAFLTLSLTGEPATGGWDIGSPGGGHSVILHDLDRPPFDDRRAVWLGADGLFVSREAASAFWRMRRSVESGGLEEPGAWSIVHVVAERSRRPGVIRCATSPREDGLLTPPSRSSDPTSGSA